METSSWTYEGPAILAGWAEDQRDGLGAVRVQVSLRVEAERDSATGGPLLLWHGTGALASERSTVPAGRCVLLLDGTEQRGEVYVSAELHDGRVTLDMQGAGRAPWWSAD